MPQLDPTSCSNNLPASFDVTPLLTKLEQILDLEEGAAPSAAGGCLGVSRSGGSLSNKVGDGEADGRNVIQRVKLIELDPYYHPQQQNEALQAPIKTRLLLAIAYGKKIVIGQLIALELGTAEHDDYISDVATNDDDGCTTNANAINRGGMENNVEKGDKHCDELEWIDVSDARILNHHPNGGGNSNTICEGGGSNVFVIFPISPRDDNDLSLDGCTMNTIRDYCQWNEARVENGDFLNVAITSCALIPAPTLGDTQLRGKLQTTPMDAKTHPHNYHHPRTVALMLGTACDQVLSLLLNVSASSVVEVANDDISDVDGVRFVLEYAECKIIHDGKLRERKSCHDDDSIDGDKDDSIPDMYPIVVQQILPCAKIFSRNKDAELRERAQRATDIMNDDEDHSSICINPNNSHVHVYHPTIALQSLSSPLTPSYERNGTILGDGVNDSGVKSITYSRRRTTNSFVVSDERIEGEGGGVDATMNHDIVWIMYGNGTIVQLPSWRAFLAFWTSSITDGNGDALVIDCYSATKINDGLASVVIPLGINFPSPLDIPPPRINQCKHHHPLSSSDDTDSKTHEYDDYWKHLCQNVLICQEAERRHPSMQRASARALILPGQTAQSLASVQSIAFLSSRVKCDPSSGVIDSSSAHESLSKLETQGLHPADDDHGLNASSEDEEYGPVTGKVVGGTAALVKGAFGMALGAVRWGLTGKGGVGATSRSLDDDDDENAPPDEFLDADDDSKNIMSTLEHAQTIGRRGREKDLVPWPMSCASFAFSDVPRRFESAVVDPSGSLVATTDNLGRVTLFDLDTKQPIRMFKGMRGVCCYFAEVPYDDGIRVSTRKYLVIHFRKRGSVEVYRLNQGPRVVSIAVPQQKDCAILHCHGPPSEGSCTSSYLLERIHGSDKKQEVKNHYIIDVLVIDDTDVLNMSSQKPAESISYNESKIHLRLLVQLLAPDTNIKCSAQTVLATFKSIHTLVDLGEALDALSKSTRLERDLGIDCSNLLSQAISYCRSRLQHARETESQEGSGAVRRGAIEDMSSKLAYFDRVIQAYDVLHRYETRNGLGSNEVDDDIGMKDNMSSWASEALHWISATSGIEPLRKKGSINIYAGNDQPMEFSMFSMSCQSHGNDRVYFTKVKRDRLPVIARVFRPLLQDLFVFKVVNSLVGSLGLEKEFDTLQQYFGEWVCNLPIEVIARSNMTGTWRPMIRWLHDLILSAYDNQGQQPMDNDALRKTVMLDTLMMFCMDMDDLSKAFLIAVICMDAVSSASMQLEQKTYGEITQREVTTPWEDLLRKLRVCLLISVRLEGDVHRMGDVIPMTVNSVSRPDVFSVYSWIALDELSLSHDNQVLLALESACLSNPESFYPTTVDSDGDYNRKAIVQSCSSPLHGRSLDDSRTQPLLFYLKDHARFTTCLAANRALLLASMWIQSPANMSLLNTTISTLHTIVKSVEGYTLATLIEIYQMQLRPICRALLFGFGEHELSDEIFSHLIEDNTWLGEFISAVKQILSMMVDCIPKLSTIQSSITPNSSEMWPPIRECPLLHGLIMKFPNVQLSSVELHHTVIFAFEMTRSVSSLETAVPSLPNLFLTGSIFTSMPHMLKGSVGQQDLLDKAILNHAASSQRPVIDNFSCLNSVELFGKSLGLDSEYVRTRFLIDMIRLGKDSSILDLLGSSISSFESKAYLPEAVVQIISVRLHATILSLKQTKKYRGVLSLLDADATRWLREEASRCSSSQFAPASLITTHSLAMRVQRMFGDTSDETLSKKIGTLCSMSETLLKAVQSQERETVMDL